MMKAFSWFVWEGIAWEKLSDAGTPLRNSLGVLFWPFKGKRRFPTCPTSFLKSSPRLCFLSKHEITQENCGKMIQLLQSYLFNSMAQALSLLCWVKCWSLAHLDLCFFHRNPSTRGFSFKNADFHVHVFYDWSIITILQYLKPCQNRTFRNLHFFCVAWLVFRNKSWPDNWGEVGRCLGRHAPCHFAVAPLGHGVRIPRFFFETLRFLSILVGEG